MFAERVLEALDAAGVPAPIAHVEPVDEGSSTFVTISADPEKRKEGLYFVHAPGSGKDVRAILRDAGFDLAEEDSGQIYVWDRTALGG